ncbi:HU domain-containing protein [Microscilla marina]|uniref:SPOR domain-containing protein n=1 Tax=Microscilla marina ATCC 23134 TaxID=313606 RepID=A1ZQU7_MICM2|nr:SPOR domain-containing protein [Microscilla marina]EAY27252.1 hypothetical protein M23134_06562 [Microscilla marina ATCC 23134]
MDSEKYPIQKYIYEWLLDHETIIVPELGQFVAEFKGASIQPTATTSSMLPPNKTVIFNTDNRDDDGVLTGFICQQEDLPEEEVQSYLKQVVTELKIALASDQKYELPAFGTFSKNPMGEIEFSADENVNFEGGSFGLPKLFYKPVEKQDDLSFFDQLDVDDEPVTPQPVGNPEVTGQTEDNPAGFVAAGDHKPENTYQDDDDDDDDFDDDDDDKPIRRKWLIPVVVILLAGVLVTAGIMYIPAMFGNGESAKKDEKTDSSKIAAANNNTGDTSVTTSTEVNLADTNKNDQGSTSSDKKEDTKTETKKEAPKTTTTENTSTGSASTGNNTTTPAYRPSATNNTNSGIISSFAYRPQTPADLSTAMLNSPTSQYYIVLGGFGNKANAYSLYNNLKSRNYPAKIMAPTGSSALHRVVLGAYSSEAEAESKRNGYTGTFGSKIWVTKY